MSLRTKDIVSESITISTTWVYPAILFPSKNMLLIDADINYVHDQENTAIKHATN